MESSGWWSAASAVGNHLPYQFELHSSYFSCHELDVEFETVIILNEELASVGNPKQDAVIHKSKIRFIAAGWWYWISWIQYPGSFVFQWPAVSFRRRRETDIIVSHQRLEPSSFSRLLYSFLQLLLTILSFARLSDTHRIDPVDTVLGARDLQLLPHEYPLTICVRYKG